MAPNIHVALRDQSQLAIPEAEAVHHSVDNAVEGESLMNLDHLPQLLSSENWDDAIALINQCHNDVERHILKVLCQGETYAVSPIHFVVGTIPKCPIPVLQALVDAHTDALLRSDARRGLSPIHLGLIKGTMELQQLNYLLSVCPELALHADMDGNLPLHVAVEYASDEMIQRIITACPAAAGYQTKRQRYALHLFAASHCQIDHHITGNHVSLMDTSTLTIGTLKALVEAYPYAIQQQDLQGRLPLHLAACTPYPRWDVVQFLCDAYPEALLMQDESHKVPLQLLKRFSSSSSSSLVSVNSQTSNPDNDIILTFLHDRTLAEKRKKNTFHKMLQKVVPFRRRADMTLSSGAIDLMNCYG